ncbi:MAG: phage Gp37/Gp68 family protein, partial [Deltaproteobacteria bacterium]|nr:phage Gp37/Gp68 family protein [Deltaproteobacteria bacterium]
LALHPERLNAPLLRRKPTLYFVNSMSDLFHKTVPDDFIEQVFDVMEQTPHHIYQLLTKRAERMAGFLASREVPHNVWIGVTVENRAHGLPRIEFLKKVRAVVHFLCMEPLLEDLGILDLTHIQWVIVGGESGPRARPMKPQWVESIKKQCDAHNTPFFFKQWGVWGPDGKRRSRKANGRRFLGRTWDHMPGSKTA